MKITFDLGKDEINIAKHGVSLKKAALFDWSEVLSLPDIRRDYGEPREIGYGRINDRLFCVVFTQRSGSMHIISMPKASSREVRNYVRQT